jgi:hypothetical protein
MVRKQSVARPSGGGAPRRSARVLDAQRHDPYEPTGKLTEPTQCSACGAVYHRGRWQWGSAPEGARFAVCPACKRIRDKLPAGQLTLDGEYAAQHRAELLNVARNEAEHERAEHPLHRIMDVDETPERVEITTTDVHLPQRIGEAIKRAHRGTLVIQYRKDEYAVRAIWRR